MNKIIFYKEGSLMSNYMEEMGKKAKIASRKLLTIDSKTKNNALLKSMPPHTPLQQQPFRLK